MMKRRFDQTGHSVLTCTPRLKHSIDALFVMPTTACLPSMYIDAFSNPIRPPIDALSGLLKKY